MKANTVLALIVGFCIGTITQSAYAERQLRSSLADNALIAAPDQYKLEFENEFVRVTRVKYLPHAKVPLHSHYGPGGVVVALTDQDARLTARDGTAREAHFKAGQVRWVASTPGVDSSTQSAHAEENLSDQPFELIRIDPKVR